MSLEIYPACQWLDWHWDKNGNKRHLVYSNAHKWSILWILFKFESNFSRWYDQAFILRIYLLGFGINIFIGFDINRKGE